MTPVVGGRLTGSWWPCSTRCSSWFSSGSRSRPSPFMAFGPSGTPCLSHVEALSAERGIAPTRDSRGQVEAHRRNTLAYLIDLLRRSRLIRYWAPVFIWMAGIFYFSSRPDPLGSLPSAGHGIDIERLAHIGEYAGLVALLHRALRGQRSPSAALRTGKGAGEQEQVTQRKSAHNPKLAHAPQHLCTSAWIALAYALFDEIHQQLAPGRGFELADIGYDLIGIIAALGLIRVKEREAETHR
jgi:hypothetical protein